MPIFSPRFTDIMILLRTLMLGLARKTFGLGCFGDSVMHYNVLCHVSPAAVGELHVPHVDVAYVLVERDAGRAVPLRHQRHHPRRAAQRPLHVPRKQDRGRRQDRH